MISAICEINHPRYILKRFSLKEHFKNSLIKTTYPNPEAVGPDASKYPLVNAHV